MLDGCENSVERLPDTILCKPAREVLAGTLGAGEADLGSGLFKKRLARPGGGKRGGYRAIIAYQAPQAERVLTDRAIGCAGRKRGDV
jgi:hypothetical protein